MDEEIIFQMEGLLSIADVDIFALKADVQAVLQHVLVGQQVRSLPRKDRDVYVDNHV